MSGYVVKGHNESASILESDRKVRLDWAQKHLIKSTGESPAYVNRMLQDIRIFPALYEPDVLLCRMEDVEGLVTKYFRLAKEQSVRKNLDDETADHERFAAELEERREVRASLEKNGRSATDADIDRVLNARLSKARGNWGADWAVSPHEIFAYAKSIYSIDRLSKELPENVFFSIAERVIKSMGSLVRDVAYLDMYRDRLVHGFQTLAGEYESGRLRKSAGWADEAVSHISEFLAPKSAKRRAK